jgi:hypothetical protein
MKWLQQASVTHIWEYRGGSNQFKPFKGNNLTTRHTRARRAPRVAIVHNAVKETIRAHLTLVHIFHAYASADTPWVAHALSHYTPIRLARIASVLAAHEATQFVGPHKISYAPVHNLNLLTGARRSVLNQHRRGLPGAQNFRSDHSHSFPSSILHFPLIAPPGLQLCQPFDLLAKPHRTSIDRKGPIVSGFQPLIFYR